MYGMYLCALKLQYIFFFPNFINIHDDMTSVFPQNRSLGGATQSRGATVVTS